jgi:hypothetical protein
MLTVTYAECHIKSSYAECHYAECRYVECHIKAPYAECRGARFLVVSYVRPTSYFTRSDLSYKTFRPAIS